MYYQKSSLQSDKVEKLRWPDIEFDPNLKIEFDDETDFELELDSNSQGETTE